MKLIVTMNEPAAMSSGTALRVVDPFTVDVPTVKVLPFPWSSDTISNGGMLTVENRLDVERLAGYIETHRRIIGTDELRRIRTPISIIALAVPSATAAAVNRLPAAYHPAPSVA